MVTKLLSLYYGELLLESNCKDSNISNTNWLRYLFSSNVFDQNLVEYMSSSLG